MKRQLLAAFAIVIGSAIQAPAATILFDFGDSAQLTAPAANYNNIIVNAPATLSVANAIDSTGAPTGVGLSAAGFFPGSNTTGATAVSGAAAIFDTQSTRDNAFGHTGAFGGNPDASLATLSLTGLNPSVAYDIVFFGSRSGVTDNRETRYALVGANSVTVDLNTASNTTNVAIAAGILPTATGTLSISVSAGPNNNNASKFYYLGAMQISNAVPEPATLGLVGVALVALVGRRTRR